MNLLKNLRQFLLNRLKNLQHLLFGQDIFISYRWGSEKENRQEYIEKLSTALEKLGLDCFIDNKTLTTGDNVQESIVKAISRSRMFVLIVTDDITKSEWIPLEIEQAVKSNCKIV